MNKKKSLVIGTVMLVCAVVLMFGLIKAYQYLPCLRDMEKCKDMAEMQPILERAIEERDINICDELPETRLRETQDGPISYVKTTGTAWDCKTEYSEEFQIPFLSENYSFSQDFSLNYPDEYYARRPSDSFPALEIEKARNKRLEIFQMKDFGDRPWGFEGTETQEDIDGYVPKEQLTIGDGDKKYDVWLYYAKNDIMTKQELHAIFDSIIIN